MVDSGHFDILVADDQQSMRELTSHVLRTLGYKTMRLVADGREALAAIAARRPHLLLLDVEMPVMDGFQTLELIRKSPHANLPVIMFTSRSDSAFVQRALALRIDGYVIKPTSPSILAARIAPIQKAAA